eukprot:SAG22_NODE_1358_length_4629_cov_1.458057_1_plen_142_part_00
MGATTEHPGYSREAAPPTLWDALDSADLAAVKRIITNPASTNLTAKQELGLGPYAFGYGFARYGHFAPHFKQWASPLHIAAHNASTASSPGSAEQHRKVVEYLVGLGASVTLEDGWGHAVLDGNGPSKQVRDFIKKLCARR